ncbi:isoprenylcysteine carboxylmethyltransferase family protein [uncultured Algoriphagus sp.]|uniref:methyltransferase family protein n=1 Tax=uncultured Algoriphagus sp. TaxID=417365 RepID=UPI00259202E9|nr:isoprenylcysteine carboxylmethyltransferase family protein [uncultured Algoriphagus sp.]
MKPKNECFYFLAILVGLLGFIIRVLSIAYAPNNTSGRNTKAGQVVDFLNTSGLYSIASPPLYLGNYFMWLSICMFIGNIWFVLVFTLFFWIYYERIIYAEECFLRKKFKSRYLEWANATPIFLPLSFRLEKPYGKFNWRKANRNEKNRIFAMFFLFLLLHSIPDLVFGNFQEIFSNLFFILAAGSRVVYLIIKDLKIKSSLLHD